MWILPKQLHTSAFVQDTKASGLDSEEFSQICEKSLTWRGKDSQSRTWLQRWKRENWMRLLCIRTLRPSHTESFEDAWTSSQEDSRASHSVLLESVKQLKTQDTYSHTSQTESGSANLELCFSKTWLESSQPRPGTENQFSNMSSEHWKKWVTEQRQEYSQRKKLAHLTNASESSSLGWPTASVAGCVEGGVAKNVEMTPNGFKATRENGTSYGAKLRDAVIHHEENWATPQSRDHLGPRRKLSEDGKNRSQTTGTTFGLDLNQQVQKNWPTITVDDSKNNGGPAQFRRISNGKPRALNLNAYIKTVGHQDQENLSTSGKNQESWNTPQVDDSKNVNPKPNRRSTLVTQTGKLNPNWVEHLMGLPVGWTQLPTEWIDSDC